MTDQEPNAAPITLSAEDLAERCPPGWNVFEYRDHYARRGFRYDEKITRALIKRIGDGEIPPADLPVPCRVPVTAEGVDERGVLIFDVRDDAETQVGARADISEASGRCRSGGKKPPLTKRYLEEHAGIAWNYRDMRDAYAVMGYAAARAAAENLLADAKGEVSLPATVDVEFLVDTTLLGGGCEMVCVNGICTHYPNDSSNAPGGG